jgi:hypothetical protein
MKVPVSHMAVAHHSSHIITLNKEEEKKISKKKKRTLRFDVCRAADSAALQQT